ncbi:MAG: hypothetical protein HC898_05080 [Phycisphaerales bacterium]|nr:hypothetical protein [Phycisphaerales bacterium]
MPKPSSTAKSTPVVVDEKLLNGLIDNSGMTAEARDKAKKLMEQFSEPQTSQAPLDNQTRETLPSPGATTPILNGTTPIPHHTPTAAEVLSTLWAGGGTGTKEDPFVITPAEWDAELKGFEEILDKLIDESWTGMYNPLVPWRRLDSKFLVYQDFHYTVSPWNRTMGGGDINYFLQGMYWRKLGLDWPAVEAIIRVWKIQYDSVALDNVLFSARAVDHMAQTPGTEMTYGQAYDAAKIVGGILVGQAMNTFFGEE